MYRLDLSAKLKDLENKDIEGAEMSKILSNALVTSQDNANAIKYWGIAQDLFKNGYRDLDKADLQLIKEFIKSAKFTVITQAQLEEAIEACEKKGELKPIKEPGLNDVPNEG